VARIVGVDIPTEKRVEFALTYIFGIGLHRSRQILSRVGIDPDVRVRNLTEEEVNRIALDIQNNYKVEGDLRRDVQQGIKRLMDIGCYRGQRHIRGLPVRGQRTKTNSRTRKGPRRTVAGKKQVTK
jgi:small subunit ribosomal protein S13